MGNYDKQTHCFEREHVQSVDYGIDFYAPQTLETPDGRRIMIAWMQNWTTTNCQSQDIRLFGSMTLPRELTICDGRLIQKPVRELENYRGRKVVYENVLISRETNLNGVNGRMIDLTVTVRPAHNNGYQWFKLNLGQDGEHCATIRYKPDSSTVRIDRTRSGGRFDIVHVRDFLVRPQEGFIKLRVIMDKNSIELFVNDGEQAATFLLSDTEIFHFGTLSMTHEGVRAATKKAAQLAKDSGAIISFDPNLRPPLWSSLEEARTQIAWGLGQCDVLKIADNEIVFMTGETDFDKGAAILKRQYPNIKILNVTSGADGSYSYYDGKKVFVPSFQLGGTIETTGAGDTFCACVLNFVLEHGVLGLTEADLTEMLRFANAAAYLVTTQKGAIRSMPDKKQIEAIL